jgi:hypothetical protein
MNPSSPVSHSRWARASYFFSVIALVAGLVVVGLRIWGGPWASLAGSLLAMPFGFWVIVRTSLYRRIYRGKSLAMLGFLFAFLGFSDAVGQIAYHRLWRQAFRLTGRETVFENKSEGWKVRYPGQWSAYTMRNDGVTTFFFKPEKTTQAIEFSLSRRAGNDHPDLDNVARDFLLALPKSGQTQILFQGEIPYPLYQHAYQVIYEDPTQSIVLRHRLVFLSHADGLTILSVAAVPSWHERLSTDSDRFLLSFEPLG